MAKFAATPPPVLPVRLAILLRVNVNRLVKLALHLLLHNLGGGLPQSITLAMLTILVLYAMEIVSVLFRVLHPVVMFLTLPVLLALYFLLNCGAISR